MTTRDLNGQWGGVVLELIDIVASYRAGGTTQPVLGGVTVRVAPGEVVAIVGASGSGKSTLLDIAAGLRAPEGGETRLDGRIVGPAMLAGTTAYMRQRDLLLPWRRAIDNAGLLLEAGGDRRSAARVLAAERFPEAGLAGCERHYPHQLSGGMRQRVAFVRTILPGRPYLLQDEPFGALDAITRRDMQGWLAALLAREGAGVLLVTHDVDEAVVLGTRALVLGGDPTRVAHEELIEVAAGDRRVDTTDQGFLTHRRRLLGALDRAREGDA